MDHAAMPARWLALKGRWHRLGIAMLAVAIVLMAGLVSMGFDNLIGEKYSNLLMRWRVILQGVAVGLMALAFLIGLA